MTKKLIALFATLPVATLGVAGLALADGDVTVENYNSAYVYNEVVTVANTGSNTASGGNGGMAGNGGAVLNSSDGNMGGNGGNGGKGGNGGMVMTGNADAGTQIDNIVNTNDTEIDRCACNGDEDGNDTVLNVNGYGEGEEWYTYVGNYVGTVADSGYNNTDGGNGGDAGNGGNVEESDDDNAGGAGGNGGNGGNAGGGEAGGVTTGYASGWTSITNLINYNLTRILR